MKKTINLLLAAAIAVTASCSTTSMTLPGGSKFSTSANGKHMAVNLPGGGSIIMDDFDHASTILAQGQAARAVLDPVAKIATASILAGAVKRASEIAANVLNVKNNNAASLAKTVNDNATAVQVKAIESAPAGTVINPITIK